MKTCRIHIFGASGSGVTTLGRALADALAIPHHGSNSAKIDGRVEVREVPIRDVRSNGSGPKCPLLIKSGRRGCAQIAVRHECTSIGEPLCSAEKAFPLGAGYVDVLSRCGAHGSYLFTSAPLSA